MITMTEAMFEDAKKMAASAERKRIKEALKSFVLRSGDRILLVNFEGDLGLLDQNDFHHLEAVFKHGNRHSAGA